MSKKWITVFLTFLLTLALIACGGSTDEPDGTDNGSTSGTTDETVEPTNEPEPTDEPEPEPTDEPEPEPTEAMEGGEGGDDGTMGGEFENTIVVWSDNLLTPVVSELIEDFQNEYGIGLVVQDVPDRNDQFPIAVPAGEGPDIIMIPHDRLGGFVDSGLIAPIDLGDKLDQFDPGALAAWTYDGQLMGVPYNIENTALFYNKDLIDTPPSTWEEAMEMGGVLVDSGDATYALALAGTTYDAFPIHTAFGGYVFGFNDNGSYNPNDVGIDGEGMIAAGEFIQENVEAGLIGRSTDWETTHVQFETGEIPFIMTGPWALERFRESGINYGIATFPSATEQGIPFLGVWGFAVNSLSDNVLLAQTFLTEVIATQETMQILADGSNRGSAFLPVTSSDPDLAVMAQAGIGANAMPAIPEMGSVWGSWGDAFTLIINGEQEPADALGNAGTQIRSLIAGAAAGMVNIPGSHQAAIGCGGDWDPACETTALTDNGDGTYSGTFTVPAGDWETKVALDGGWTLNYGVDGEVDGENITYSLAEESEVTFIFDAATKLLSIIVDGEDLVGGGMMDGDDMSMAECTVDMSGEEVVVYQQAGREGPLAAILGDGFALATEDAVDYINANGGVCGAELIVEFCETNYAVEKELECYEGFRAADPKPTVLLTYGSGATIALKDRVVEDDILNFGSGLNAEAAYYPEGGNTFLAAPIYSDQLSGFATYLSENWADVKPEGAGDDIVIGVIGWDNAFGNGATTPEALAYIETLGNVKVLDVELQEISPEADVLGQVLSLVGQGANVIYNQNLSFSTTQVIGTVRGAELWDSVIVGGVNWSFNTDVVAFLGDSPQAANGYYGVFPYAWFNDTDLEGVKTVTDIMAENGRGAESMTVTYLTTFGTFFILDELFEATIMEYGADGLTGANVKATLEKMGSISGQGLLTLNAADGDRAPRTAQIRQMQFNGESIDFVVVEDFFELPDTRP